MSTGRAVGGWVGAAASAVATTFLAAQLVTACDATFSFDEQSIDAGASGDAAQDAADAASTEGGGTGGPCTSDAQCGGLRCDVTTNVCVACLGNDDCTTAGRSFCAKPLGICVECVSSDTCGSRKRCDTSANRCVDTCADGDELCPSGLSCYEDRKLCVECREKAHCNSKPGTPFCDTGIGRCVQCASSAQCDTAKPTCDRRSGSCVECLTSLACSSGSVCDPTTLVCRAP